MESIPSFYIMMQRFLEKLLKGHGEEMHDLLRSLLNASQNIMEGEHPTKVYCFGLIHWPLFE